MAGGWHPEAGPALRPVTLERISYSALKHFYWCPLRYRFQHEEKRPVELRYKHRAFIGMVLARAVDAFYAEEWWREPTMVVERGWQRIPEIAAAVTLEQAISWPAGHAFQAAAEARELWPPIVETIRRERLIGIENRSEYDLGVEMDGVAVIGRIDLLIRHPGGQLTLLDGKAGKSLGKFIDPDQLRLYALLTRAHYGRFPDRVGWWWFRYSKIVWRRMSAQSLARFADGVRGTLARVRTGDRVPTPGGHCAFCPFLVDCEAGQQERLRRTKLPLGGDGGEGQFIGF